VNGGMTLVLTSECEDARAQKSAVETYKDRKRSACSSNICFGTQPLLPRWLAKCGAARSCLALRRPSLIRNGLARRAGARLVAQSWRALDSCVGLSAVGRSHVAPGPH
jgi:hypothetical protein